MTIIFALSLRIKRLTNNKKYIIIIINKLIQGGSKMLYYINVKQSKAKQSKA